MTAERFLDEARYLAEYDIHQFALPLVTVDVVIFTLKNQRLEVLLVKRGAQPRAGKWALPGGFIDIAADADLEAAALRKLAEKTGVHSPYLEQLETVGNGFRDPRGWSVTVVYFALIYCDSEHLGGRNPQDDVAWTAVDQALERELAFDHNYLLSRSLERLRNKVAYTAIPVHLLPESFTLTELKSVFEIILGRPMEKSAFRRRIREAGLLEALSGQKRGGSNRPAQLYRVKPSFDGHFFARSLAAAPDKPST